MTQNVDPQEAAALQAGLAQGEEVSVAERDFTRLQRFSANQLAELERALAGRVPEAEQRIAEVAGIVQPLELSGVEESSAADLFQAEDAGPYAALRFEVDGQLGWILWENLAAVRSVERVLGSHAEVKEPRRLTSVEESVLQSLLAPVADAVLAALGVEGEELVVAQSREALGSYEDAGPAADPYRLRVTFQLEGTEGTSTVECYVPSAPSGQSAEAAPSAPLPSHLDRVTVEVSARIPGCEIPLAQLLELEEGDVVPLDGQVGDLATLCVEGKPHATAQLGTHRGLVAVRIEHLLEEGEIES